MPSAQLFAYRAATATARSLPGDVACRLGSGVGRVIAALPDYDGRRAVVASHMARAAGRPLSRREARSLVGEVFANYGRYWAESLRLPLLSPREVADGIVTVGQEHLDAALAGGRGAIVAAPHLGGWEWGAIYLVTSGIPVTVAVEPLEPPEVFEWFAAFRRRLGMNVVPVGPRAAASVLRALGANHVVCLLSDRLVGQAAGVKVDLFGGKLLMPAGPVTLSLRSGAPLLTAAIYYGKATGSHTLVFRPPLDLARLPPARFREQVRMGTQELAHELEALVRRAPTQWHLVQPNWPDDPPLRSLRLWARSGSGGRAGRRPVV
jgi:lauroyl/myristoyl acyltransferase